MNAFLKWFHSLFRMNSWTDDPNLDPHQLLLVFMTALVWVAIAVAAIYSAFHSNSVYAAEGGVSLPGDDMSANLKAAGILLKTLDTGIFKWGARVFAGLCIMSSAWALKEQRFGIAIICVIGAIIFGTAPKWVADIFTMGGNGGIFSESSANPGPRGVYLASTVETEAKENA